MTESGATLQDVCIEPNVQKIEDQEELKVSLVTVKPRSGIKGVQS